MIADVRGNVTPRLLDSRVHSRRVRARVCRFTDQTGVRLKQTSLAPQILLTVRTPMNGARWKRLPILPTLGKPSSSEMAANSSLVSLDVSVVCDQALPGLP